MDFEVTLKMEAPVLRMLEQGDRSADPRWPCCHCCYVAKLCSTLRYSMTVVHQAPLTMGEEQKCWSGLSCHLQGIFLTQGLNLSLLCLLHWQVDSFTTESPE